GVWGVDRVDWEAHPSLPRGTRRTPADIEDLIWDLRRRLTERSDLGPSGAEAIFEALLERGTTPLPSIRTIGRILRRRGALDGKRRVRRPPPPPGRDLPVVAARQAQLDCIDLVEGLAIQRRPHLRPLQP